MSETSQEKTKREYLSTYQLYEWRYQSTIFLQDYSQRYQAIELFKEVRRRLPRLYPETAILWRIILSHARSPAIQYLKKYDETEESVLLPALSLFSYDKLPKAEMSAAVQHHLSSRKGQNLTPINVMQKYFSKLDQHRYIHTIRREKPHDLAGYFNRTTSPQRYGVLSARYAKRIDDTE